MNQKQIKKIRKFVRESYGEDKDVKDMKNTFKGMSHIEKNNFTKHTNAILDHIK